MATFLLNDFADLVSFSSSSDLFNKADDVLLSTDFVIFNMKYYLHKGGYFRGDWTWFNEFFHFLEESYIYTLVLGGH